MALAYLDGVPIPLSLLDARVAQLRSGPRASALPVPGSAEDRQLRRWVAQVIITERLCETSFPGEASLARLDPVAAVELGSINAAAFEGSAGVRAAFAHIAAGVEVDEDRVATYLAATSHRPRPLSRDDAVAHVRDAAARRAFVIWLDGERERRVRLVPGLEHPGDPGQPDNHHRH